VRWTKEDRSDEAKSLITGTLTDLAPPDISSNNWSPEISVTYLLTDDFTLFGDVKQGYKSGSYQITTPAKLDPVTGLTADNSFGDEKVDGGELGLKSRLFDRSLAMNLAGYYYVYKGLQVGANDAPTGGVPNIRVINAGEAKVYGVDFDFSYRFPIEGLSANGAVNWNHSRFTDLKGVACFGGQLIQEGCNGGFDGTYYNTQTLNGLQLVRAPAIQANLGGNYDWHISDGFKMAFGADAQYTSQYPTTLSFRPDTWQKSYTLYNAHISAGDPDDHWEVAFIGNNLSNKITTGSCTMFNGQDSQVIVFSKAVQQPTGSNSRGTAGIDEVVCTPRPGREYWLRLTVKAFGPSK
jgi:iron complex outermembrane receptor protein